MPLVSVLPLVLPLLVAMVALCLAGWAVWREGKRQDRARSRVVRNGQVIEAGGPLAEPATRGDLAALDLAHEKRFRAIEERLGEASSTSTSGRCSPNPPARIKVHFDEGAEIRLAARPWRGADFITDRWRIRLTPAYDEPPRRLLSVRADIDVDRHEDADEAMDAAIESAIEWSGCRLTSCTLTSSVKRHGRATLVLDLRPVPDPG